MDSLPIINHCYLLYKNAYDLTSHMEKRQRFGLGQSLEQGILNLLDYLIISKNAPKTHKATYLIKASGQLEVTILKLRLILELKLANETKIFRMQEQLAEIGRMLGGWLKSLS